MQRLSLGVRRDLPQSGIIVVAIVLGRELQVFDGVFFGGGRIRYPVAQALPNNWGTCAGTSCGYQYAYGDGSSTEGELAYETFTVTNVDGSTTAIPNVTFGCGHNQTGISFNGADGVAGMGQGQISLPSQFQNFFPDIFTYCLVSASSSSSTATVNSSTLLFGSPENTGAGISSLVYTPLLENLIFPTFYYVRMTGISVGGTLLTIPTTNFDIAVDGTGGVIFDSGTTYTLLPLDAYNAASQVRERKSSS
jgi:hypothetical protein